VTLLGPGRLAVFAFSIGFAGMLSLGARAEEIWQSDWGMGITTAWVDLEPGNRLSVTCTGAYGRPIASVEFTLGGRLPPPNSLVTVLVDQDNALEVPVDDESRLGADSRLEAAWFDAVLASLKSGNAAFVRFADGKSATFSLTGSNEAIGDCPADFWRTDLDR
jgi:hypothetical protein